MPPSLLLLLPLAAAAPLGEGGVLRHALVVGVNDGGPGMDPLRYAETDARRMAEVLGELGGFQASNITVLQDPDRDELQSALRAHHAIAAASPQDLFLFYYSGHADALGLKLGTETLPYGELRQSVRDMPAEVRLGVLDACRSGEITRLKGLHVAAPFAMDTSLPAEGEAWLTATAAEEAAQESDRLEGSFFTHYLVSGLRGAADAGGSDGGDGVVSLGEVYAYAYDRTVARTGATDAGTQHPGYDFRLQGSGDLAITDLREGGARISLPMTLGGELTILRLPAEIPVAEIAKQPGTTVIVALQPGNYLLRLRDDHAVHEARIGLSEGSDLVVPDFTLMDSEAVALKGEDAEDPTALALPAAPASPPAAQPPAEPPQGGLARFAQKTSAAIGQWSKERAEALSFMVEHSEDEGQEIAYVDPGELPEPEEPILRLAPCAQTGPACADALIDQPQPESIVEIPWADGSLAARGRVGSQGATGTWVFYYETGEPFAGGEYVGGLRSGTWTWWGRTGLKSAQGSFLAGRRTGTWLEWHDNGERRRRTAYAEDSPAGAQVEWFENGQKKSLGELNGEKRTGTWTFWYDSGRRRARGDYAVGGRNGSWTTWHSNGRRSSKGDYRSDRRVGSWRFWWESGEEMSIGAFDQGAKTGRWTELYPDGRKRSVGRYEAGLRVGRWIFWDQSGARTVRRLDQEPDEEPSWMEAPSGTVDQG